MTDSQRKIDKSDSEDSDIIFLDDNDNEISSKYIASDSEDNVPLVDLASTVKVFIFIS